MSSKQFRPKILGFISEQTSAWMVAIVAFLIGAMLTAMLAMASTELYQRQLRQRFDLLAGERVSRIQERLDNQARRLDSLRRFFIYSDEVTRREFAGFATPLLISTEAYAWAPRVTDAERSTFENRAREDVRADYSILEPDGQGGFRRAGRRETYFPLLFVQSMGGKAAPAGFDMLSIPLRQATLERARQLGTMVASPRTELLGHDDERTDGVLLVSPVLSSVARTDGQPRDVLGYVVAAINLKQLMTEGLSVQDNLAVSLRDLTASADEQLLYQSPSDAASEMLRVSSLLGMADRDYLLEIRPTATFLSANESSTGDVIVLGGLLSLLLSGLLYSLVGQRQRALYLVDQRTAELRMREQQLRGTHGQLRNVLNAATEVAVIATDLNGVITTFNVGAQKMLGYRDEEVLGRLSLKDFQLAAELERHGEQMSQRYGRRICAAEALFVEAAEEDGHESQEWTLLRRDGSSLQVNMLVTAVRDEQEQWVGYLAVCIDVTERKRVHEALAARDQLLEKLSANVPGGIYQYRLEANGRSGFTYTSVGMGSLFELSEEEMRADIGVILARINPLDVGRVRKSIRQSADHLTPWHEEYRVELPVQGQRWIRGEATPERQSDGAILWHGFFSDISDTKRVEEELRALSVTDVLTGVYNRRFFQDRLRSELARLERYGGEMSVIMLDIDHFKRINDKYGHGMGDKVLQTICQRISQRLRRNDVFCRLGGEEFVVLCPGTSAWQAQELAVQLRQSLRNQPIEGVGQVTASFGIAGWRDKEDGDALLLRADSGVYAAKQAGRDRVEPERA
ncbi:diguanylate cyclase [Pseudomonas sp. Pseusp122]|uniref:sensor domain-containing diguanylate cyclase n=1 Tax=unclassified Pseudomonas TaxID=196821 RepID=UPI0039A62C6A